MAASLLAGESGPAWTSGATRTVEEVNGFVEALMDPTRTARHETLVAQSGWIGERAGQGDQRVNPCSGRTDG